MNSTNPKNLLKYQSFYLIEIYVVHVVLIAFLNNCFISQNSLWHELKEKTLNLA